MDGSKEYLKKINNREEARKHFEATKCDPSKNFITYCADYTKNKSDACPHTCFYARERDGKLEKTINGKKV